MKKRIKTHFQYSWWVYLLVIVAVITLWISAFSKLAEPKVYERLNITIVGNVDGKNISTDLDKALEGKTAKPIKELNVEVVSGKNIQLAEIIAMRCIGDCDVVIFEEDFIGGLIAPNFRPLDDSKLLKCFPDAELYKIEDKTYGTLLFDGASQTNFKTYYKGDKKFYAFVTPVSENCAQINGKGEEQHNAAILALKYFTEAANV